MHAEVTMSGTGGQGILFIGRLLAEAALREGHEIAWLPSYGAEKRGGVVACHLTISDEKIGSLVVTRPTAAIAMNADSVERLEPAMRPGGVLVINESIVPKNSKRGDIRTLFVTATELAAETGDDTMGNMVLLGAFLATEPLVSTASVIAVLEAMLGKNPQNLEKNRRAFLRGYSG